jgi:hypothetical protein
VHVSSELDRLADKMRKYIFEHATLTIPLYLKKGLDRDQSKLFYVDAIKQTRDYIDMSKVIEGIISDVVKEHNMDRWFAESLFGFNLDKELSLGFDRAWDNLS